MLFAGMLSGRRTASTAVLISEEGLGVSLFFLQEELTSVIAIRIM
jgi:hypothetical protein